MWHTGLRARLDTSFPKKCTTCGRIFETAEQFFTETSDINDQDKGLKPFVDDDTTVIIEAFRNCPCGSTLMEMFEDSEDTVSEQIAQKKREDEISKSMKVENPFDDSASLANSLALSDAEFAESTKTGDAAAAVARGTSPGDLETGINSGFSELDLLYVEERWGSEWYRGLRPRGESAFPKECPNCGRIYDTPDDFFSETGNIKLDETGLRAYTDEVDGVVIEAFRNCVCGSTLMDNFSDRRDMSPAGRERRDKFEQMLNYLVGIGLNADTAYAELRKVTRGGESKILAKIKPPE